jgi:hypothetical protein
MKIKEYFKYKWIQCTMCGCYARDFRFGKKHKEINWFYKGKIVLCCLCQIINEIDTRLLPQIIKQYLKDHPNNDK